MHSHAHACPFALLLAVSLAAPIAARADWTERTQRAWQDGDTIHAMGIAREEPDALARAATTLAASLSAGLPQLDPQLAARSAVLGDRVERDGLIYVRLDFPARYGNACRSSEAWLTRGLGAREQGDADGAFAALAHAAWLEPGSAAAVGALGQQLAEVGLWGTAAMVLDDAAASVDDPPVILLRNACMVHIWMRDPDGAARAIAQLRDFDEVDPELSTLDALAQTVRRGPVRLTESEVMPYVGEHLDAQLASAFTVWGMLAPDARQAYLEQDLERGSLERVTRYGDVRFEQLRGSPVDGRSFMVRDRDDAEWTVTLEALPPWTSCLARAAELEPADELTALRTRMVLGGLYAVGDPAEGGPDETWLHPTWYVTPQDEEERVRLDLLLRWGETGLHVILDGPTGAEAQGRQGLLTCPQLVQMLTTAARPHTGETP